MNTTSGPNLRPHQQEFDRGIVIRNQNDRARAMSEMLYRQAETASSEGNHKLAERLKNLADGWARKVQS